ncbi:unnamed protein product [Darwinula stevensoni]|uniref:Uncharacterized protein n=1 Tax=Darwinula stevensoni TaxID=69355 RepID=A0A7R8X9L3_9CRUS|nr:unnamed protein product [Darwinula stevensoni]CAG0889773.1 unnamed protein product [Darwinula stevensoni]
MNIFASMKRKDRMLKLETKRIEVIDGREKNLEKDLNTFKTFLQYHGMDKHVLIDEVPLTLGFNGVISPEVLYNHWRWILNIKRHLKSITVSFRTNDQSYVRDFLLKEFKSERESPIKVLRKVKRNSKAISELFLAIGDFSRRVFLSSENSLKMDMTVCDGYIPRLFAIPSCQVLHRECKNKAVCEAVRVFGAIQTIYEECSKATNKMAVFIVVNDEMRKNALVNILASSNRPIPFLFNGLSTTWRWYGKSAPGDSFPLVVVTEDEMIGSHVKNVVVVVDFPNSKWRNYCRLIATTGNNKILVLEEEDLITGKFSHVKEKIPEMRYDPVSKCDDVHVNLESAWKRNGKAINELEWSDFTPASSPPLIELDGNVWEKEDEEHSQKMLQYWFTGIFGCPASGKSRKIDTLIRRVVQLGGRVLLLHCERSLTRKVYRQGWNSQENVEIVYFPWQITSLQDIIDSFEVKMMKEKVGTDSLVVIVDDCPIWNAIVHELENVAIWLKQENMRLILSFQSHSKNANDISLEEIMEVLENSQNCTAIRINTQPTDVRLMSHVQENETSTPLNLMAGNLYTSSIPSTSVREDVLFMKYACSGSHWGYICRGKESHALCIGNQKPVLSHFLEFALSQAREHEETHVLVLDDQQLSALKTTFTKHDYLSFTHPKDFRGCESSVVISINATDEWLLETTSRSRLQLIVIDNNPSHVDLWDAMVKEKRVQPLHVGFPKDKQNSCIDRKTLLSLDDEKKFLRCPTWNEAASRMGEEAVERGGILDEDTGVILTLSEETWAAIDEHISRSSSSPFTDWGYVWVGEDGEVPRVDEEKRKRILDKLRQSGVEWEEDYLPTPLEMKGMKKGCGVLESLSLTLTGSLLHLSLLEVHFYLKKKGRRNNWGYFSLPGIRSGRFKSPLCHNNCKNCFS